MSVRLQEPTANETIEERLRRLEEIVGLRRDIRWLPHEERIARLELLLRRLGITNADGKIGVDVELGGWKTDVDSIYTKAGTDALLIDMDSQQPRIDTWDAGAEVTLSEDTFTDSDGRTLTAHTPDTGPKWTNAGGAGALKIVSNKLGHAGSGGGTSHAKIDLGGQIEMEVYVTLHLPAEVDAGTIEEFIVRPRIVPDGFGNYLATQEMISVHFNPGDSNEEVYISYNDGSGSVQDAIYNSGLGWNWNGSNDFKIVVGTGSVDVYHVVGGTETLILSNTDDLTGIATSGHQTMVTFSNIFRSEGWEIDDWSVTGTGSRQRRVRIGKLGSGTSDYGLSAWDKDGNQILDGEGLGDALYLYDEFTVAATPSYTYTLTETPASNAIEVALNGLFFRSDEFSVSGTTLTIDSGQVTLTTGDTITVHYAR